MSEISLNASMRSNLLSLQQTIALQDMTQLRLSTGLKVNSAIDNPSAYYTASSLSNRAEDLSQLLDAMSQGIQTLKAVSNALELGSKYLEQAKATARQALDKTGGTTGGGAVDPNPEPDYSDYTHVSTADELKAALSDAGVDKIVLTQSITLSAGETLMIESGKTLAGINKSITITALAGGSNNAITMCDNSKLENLNLEISHYNISAIYIDQANVILNHINITNKNSSGSGDCIVAKNNSTIKGDIKIKFGADYDMSAIDLSESLIDANVVLIDEGLLSQGITASNSTIKGNINILMNGMENEAICAWERVILAGEVNITGSYPVTSYGNIIITSEAIIKSSTFSSFFGQIYSNLTIEAGAQLWIAEDASDIMTGYRANSNLTNVTDFSGLTATGNNLSSADFIAEMNAKFNPPAPASMMARIASLPQVLANGPAFEPKSEAVDYTTYQNQYNSILDQYNQLINDASYKGINLLLSQNLKINFNEDRSSKLEINGIDGSSQGLGLTKAGWSKAADIEKGVSELESAIGKLRTYSAQFGNYNSIVSSREEFTQNLINVLTEGSDKLTLADMNEESANMLALQTRQQLAINSLSLASQAGQSILRLF